MISLDFRFALTTRIKKMTEEYRINDPELGSITIRRSSRLKRYKLIVKQGAIFANLPAVGNERELLQFIETHRQRLLAAIQRTPKPTVWAETTDQLPGGDPLRGRSYPRGPAPPAQGRP